jgi:FkbM family methyltransferase
MDNPHDPHAGRLTRDHVVWAYRLILDREPENEDVIGPKLAGSGNTQDLRRHLITSGEYREKNPDFAQANDRTVVIKELDGLTPAVRLFVDLSDHVIGLEIIRGRFESNELAFVRSVLRPGDTAVDVGAHIGFFAMQMAALVGPTGRVYAFEPLAANAELLERSIAENSFNGRVVFQRAAVGATSGSAALTFPVETLNTGGAYILRDGTDVLMGHLKTTVRLTALDDLDLRRPVRFIKMDVEGAEPQVVRGARRLLEADRPIILSEVHPTQLDRASGLTAREFLDELRTMGYDAQDLHGAPIDHAPGEGLQSVVFVPRT